MKKMYILKQNYKNEFLMFNKIMHTCISYGHHDNQIVFFFNL